MEKLKVVDASHAEMFAEIGNLAVLPLLLRTGNLARYDRDVCTVWDGIGDQERVLPNLLQFAVAKVGSVALIDDLLKNAAVYLTS